MKINDTSRIGNVNPYRKSNSGQHPSADPKKGKKDEVQISPEAKELLNGVRSSDKLEELKKAVSTGTYQVDARKVAEKLWPFLK